MQTQKLKTLIKQAKEGCAVRRRQRGFTLVEVLIALAVAALAAVGVFMGYQQAMDRTHSNTMIREMQLIAATALTMSPAAGAEAKLVQSLSSKGFDDCKPTAAAKTCKTPFDGILYTFTMGNSNGSFVITVDFGNTDEGKSRAVDMELVLQQIDGMKAKVAATNNGKVAVTLGDGAAVTPA